MSKLSQSMNYFVTHYAVLFMALAIYAVQSNAEEILQGYICKISDSTWLASDPSVEEPKPSTDLISLTIVSDSIYGEPMTYAQTRSSDGRFINSGEVSYFFADSFEAASTGSVGFWAAKFADNTLTVTELMPVTGQRPDTTGHVEAFSYIARCESQL